VCNLIDQDMKQWNSKLIFEIFLLKEAAVIFNIPLSPFQPRDRLIWRCTTSGGFTVRSAYHLGMERQMSMKAGSLETSKISDLWKQCWSLNVPNAVKMYMWKACHNLLPTKANLFRRGVCENNQCPICLRAEETVVHVAWACPVASDVWGESRIRLQKSVNGEYNFTQVFMDVISRCENEEVELFAVLARRLWLRRNDYVHGGSLTHPSQVV
jgi:hypothetical protein